MSQSAQLDLPHSGRRMGRIKVKSGCRTCKARKVKCDESRPACQRCLTTGRVCEGYGIWGGGGNSYGHRQAVKALKTCNIIARQPDSVSGTLSSVEDKFYFEWFVRRTSKKLPGAFILTFWDVLLVQASMNEPAVLHAVLTLSSVHKNDIVHTSMRDPTDEKLDEQEQFMLKQYIKAIGHLQPHFSNKGVASVRIALITCLIFVFLEFLRGRFRTAQEHFENGLGVLRELRISSHGDERAGIVKAPRESIDDWIFEAFSRLHIQVELLRHRYQLSDLFVHEPRPRLSSPAFHSINEAWREIERILNLIFHTTKQARAEITLPPSVTTCPSALHATRQRIQAELAQWSSAFEASMEHLLSQEAGEVRCQLLCEYHAMAIIMANASLRPDDESVYDSYTDLFVLLINQSASLRQIRSLDRQIRQVPVAHIDMSRSIVDIGWIPPLYFTALKCRIHRIRLQAIRLLESARHREGIWDSHITARVARKVMELEERDFYRYFNTDDEFELGSNPGPEAFSLPILPLCYRIHNVTVGLPNGPSDIVSMSYKEITGFGRLKDAWICV